MHPKFLQQVLSGRPLVIGATAAAFTRMVGAPVIQNEKSIEFEARLDWRQNTAAYMANGITEDDLVKSRRIDAGLDRLEPGAAANAAASAAPVNSALLADPANTAFRLEYSQGAAVYMRNGISEVDYIRTRRIDTGLDQLQVGGAATN